MKKILLVISVMSIFLLAGCTQKGEAPSSNVQENNVDYQEQVASNDEGQKEGNSDLVGDSTMSDEKMVTEYLKIIHGQEVDNPDGGLKYDLIYFNKDDIPDLVVGRQRILGRSICI